MPRKLRREPVGNGERFPSFGEPVRRRMPEGEDGNLAEALDRLPVAGVDGLWLVRPWRQDHGLNPQGDRARRLDREEAVADRAEAGAGGYHDGERELAGEVSDEVVGCQRDEEAADALDDERVALDRLRLCRGHQ